MRDQLIVMSVVLGSIVAAGFLQPRMAPVAPSCPTTNPIHADIRSSDRPIRVLFIGNSLVYVNDLPGMLQAMAQTSVPQIRSEKVAIPDASLQEQWERGDALRAIRSSAWDYVVLQERSGLLFTDRPRMAYYVQLFDKEIRRQGAQTILFMTWADEDRQEDEIEIARAYAEAAASTCGAIVAPVGIAFQTAEAEHPAETLYYGDKHHAGPAGTYLAAAVFYRLFEGASFLKVRPTLASVGAGVRLPDKEVDFLLDVAEKVNVPTAWR